MAVVDVEFRSEAMGRDVSYSMILPETGEGPYPVLFQLHGLGDNNRSWIEKSMLPMHVRDYPLAVVMPDGASSGYFNWKAAGRLARQNYEDLIITNITNHVGRHFRVTDGPWAIGGLSMGGWGAMYYGLKYPERFASIWSHSSKFDWKASQLDLSMLANPQDVELFALAESITRLDRKPVISFDCGVDDELIDENRALHAHMDQIGLLHTYNEHGGGHTWDYWDLHVQEALDQHARVLGIAKATG